VPPEHAISKDIVGARSFATGIVSPSASSERFRPNAAAAGTRNSEIRLHPDFQIGDATLQTDTPAAGNLAFASNGHQLSAVDFNNPAILLAGAVDYAMYALFRNRLTSAPESGLVVIELSTLGGDPEVARMMGEDIRFHSDLEPARRFVFLGKAAITRPAPRS
jgi:hypothetical protein